MHYYSNFLAHLVFRYLSNSLFGNVPFSGLNPKVPPVLMMRILDLPSVCPSGFNGSKTEILLRNMMCFKYKLYFDDIWRSNINKLLFLEEKPVSNNELEHFCIVSIQMLQILKQYFPYGWHSSIFGVKLAWTYLNRVVFETIQNIRLCQYLLTWI